MLSEVLEAYLSCLADVWQPLDEALLVGEAAELSFLKQRTRTNGLKKVNRWNDTLTILTVDDSSEQLPRDLNSLNTERNGMI